MAASVPVFGSKMSSLSSQMFQPPQTPASDSQNSYYASLSRQTRENLASNTTSSISRKRARPESTPERYRRDRAVDLSRDSLRTPTSLTATNDFTPLSEELLLRSDGAMSPKPFVDTRYRLSGDLDTPGLSAAARYNDTGGGFRRRWDDGSVAEEEMERDKDVFSAPNGAVDHGSRRSSTYERSPDGLGRYVFSFVGGVVGKVWEFCRTGAFKGFYAGGGSGYSLSNPGENPTEDMGTSTPLLEIRSSRLEVRESTPIPGGFPQDQDEAEDDPFQAGNEYQTTSHRPAKRLHTESSDSSGWVMVHDDPTRYQRAASPARITSRRSHLPRAISTPQASPASSPARRSLIPVSRRQRHTPVSHSSSPALRNRRQSSRAPSVQSPAQSSGFNQTSPSSHPVKHVYTSPEARKYAARMRKAEADAERDIGRLNSQIQSLIRQGKEALGTKVEVTDQGPPVGDGRFDVDEIVDVDMYVDEDRSELSVGKRSRTRAW